MTTSRGPRTPGRRAMAAATQVVLVGGLGWAVWRLAGSGVLSTLAAASPKLLGACLAASVASHVAAAGRWHCLAPAGHGYARLLRINVESHFWAQIVPGGVAADGYRVLALRRRGSDPHHAAASVVLERALGLVALLLLCGPALALGSQWLSDRIVLSLSALAGLLLTIVVVSACAAVWSPVRRGRLRWLPDKVRAACAEMERSFASYRGQRGRLLRGLAWGLAYHLCFLAVYVLAGQAFGVELGIGGWLVAVPLATLASTLPLNAWGIGVREGAIVLLLVSLGVPAPKAGAVSIAVVGMQAALGFSGGISQVARRRRAYRVAQTTAASTAIRKKAM